MSFLGIDMTELSTLAKDLTEGGLTVGLRIVPVMHRAANNIVRDARENAPGANGGSARLYPHSITYDLEVGAEHIAADIGPDKDLPQGPLGNIFEYGTSTQPPHPHLNPALDREVPKFEEFVAEVASRFL